MVAYLYLILKQIISSEQTLASWQVVDETHFVSQLLISVHEYITIDKLNSQIDLHK